MTPRHERAGRNLDRAKELITGDRAAAHGDPLPNHQNIARLWEAYLGVEVTPQDVALMMALLKVARTQTGPHNPDNYHDLAGYAALAEAMADAEN